MVSLHEIMLQKSAFLHMSTSIPSLDALLTANKSNGICDFQSVPGCNAAYSVVSTIMISHLKNGGRVVVVDCWSLFPLQLLEEDADYDESWDSKIITYSTDTFAKLLALLISDKLSLENGRTMVVINQFHELVELYRLELNSAYKEMLLKIQISQNATVLNQKERIRTEGPGSAPPLLELPPQSDLRRVSPGKKFQSHLSALINMISNLAYKNGLMCILMGTLTTKYEKYSMKPRYQSQSSSQSSSISPPSSSSLSSLNQVPSKGRVVLTPYLSSGSIPAFSSDCIIDSFLSFRLVFYRDWYHNSPDFEAKRDQQGMTLPLDQSLLKAVFVVDLFNPQASLKAVSKVYFDYDSNDTKNKFIDLSTSNLQEADNEPNISRTEVDSPSNDLPLGSKTSALPIPSSPNLTESQVGELLNTTDSFNRPEDLSDSASRCELVIEASDEENATLQI
ncbi:uncharacterized protein PRCAT00004927001 [Priceomyces carsonii]|uniref:uncharacterized protein n=1 Tax=Priceomyces carsonii TaxID=28549 RepID=UPI002ED98480|nr:unnamed protein product [Priceomyces carsonii]